MHTSEWSIEMLYKGLNLQTLGLSQGLAGEGKDAMLRIQWDLYLQTWLFLKDVAGKAKDANTTKQFTSSDLAFVQKTWQAKKNDGTMTLQREVNLQTQYLFKRHDKIRSHDDITKALTSSEVAFVSKTWQAKDGVGGPVSGLAPVGLVVLFLVMKPNNLK